VVDDEVDVGKRVDFLRVATERHHCIAHCSKVNDSGNAREVLHQHACGAESDFAVALLVLKPLAHCLDVIRLDAAAIFKAQQILEQYLQ